MFRVMFEIRSRYVRPMRSRSAALSIDGTTGGRAIGRGGAGGRGSLGAEAEPRAVVCHTAPSPALERAPAAGGSRVQCVPFGHQVQWNRICKYLFMHQGVSDLAPQMLLMGLIS